MNGAAVIVGGTVVATAAAYGFQVVGGRVLGPSDFAPLTALWTVQFVVMTVLYLPLEHYSIRQIELRRRLDWPVIITCVAVCTLLVSAFVYASRAQLFAGQAAYAGIAACMTLATAAFALVRAQLAGTRRFTAYGLATGAEGVLRLVAAAAILWVTTAAVGLAWAMVVAPLAVLAWAGRFPKGGSPQPAAGILLPMIGASLCAQLLIGAAPIAVGLLGASAATVSIVFVTFALLRGPLWILQALLARVLPPLTAMARDGSTGVLRAWSRRITWAGSAAAAAAAAVGYVVGPLLVSWLFGPAFQPPGMLAALVSAGVVVCAAGLLSNQILIASARTGYMSAAWLIGLIAALAVLLVPGSPAIRVGVAFLVGQVVALGALTFSIGRVCSGPPLQTLIPSGAAVPGGPPLATHQDVGSVKHGQAPEHGGWDS